jgi:CheY-like chemotaxis protein
MMGNAYYVELSSVGYQRTMPAQNGDSFSSPVIRRILRILLENGALKKSSLCGKAGLNYKVCTRYVNFLAMLHWIEIRQGNDKGVRISISDEGISNLRKLESDDNGSNLITPIDCPRTNIKAIPQSKYPNNTGQTPRNANVRSNDSRTIRKKKIVIIDDDENALVTYSAFLEKDKRFKVMTFSNSQKALEYLTTHPNSCDLIILDIRMPGMSGLRLYQAIKAINPNTTIIFLSSLDAGPELSEMCSDSKLGNRNFLRKPVSRANFIETVTRAVS